MEGPEYDGGQTLDGELDLPGQPDKDTWLEGYLFEALVTSDCMSSSHGI